MNDAFPTVNSSFQEDPTPGRTFGAKAGLLEVVAEVPSLSAAKTAIRIGITSRSLKKLGAKRKNHGVWSMSTPDLNNVATKRRQTVRAKKLLKEEYVGFVGGISSTGILHLTLFHPAVIC